MCNSWTHDFQCFKNTNAEETVTSIHLVKVKTAGQAEKIVFKHKNGGHNNIIQTLESNISR